MSLIRHNMRGMEKFGFRVDVTNINVMDGVAGKCEMWLFLS